MRKMEGSQAFFLRSLALRGVTSVDCSVAGAFNFCEAVAAGSSTREKIGNS